MTDTPFNHALNWIETRTDPIAGKGLLDLAFAAGFLVFVLGLLALGYWMTEISFDYVAYIGATLLAFGSSASPMDAWEFVRQYVSPEAFTELTSAYPYRQVQSTDQVAFQSNLPLYSVKVGDIYLLQSLGPTLGWIQAGVWVNTMVAVLFALVCLYWMVKTDSIQGAPIVAAVLLSMGFFDLIKTPSPDLIASTLILIAAYLWIQSRQVLPLVLLLAAFLFRPDTLIFVFALYLASYAFGLPKLRLAILFVALLIGSNLIHLATSHPGWWIHYYFSNVQIQDSLVGFDPAFSIMAWIKGQARGVVMALTQFNWPILLIFLGTAILALQRCAKGFSKRQSALIMASVLTIGGKFLVFPLPDDRLYLVFIVTTTLVLLDIAKPRLWANERA